MLRNLFTSQFPVEQAHHPLLVLVLVIGNMAFNIISNLCFKYSSAASSVHNFIVWQVVGNLAGFVTVITLTWMLKYIPLNVAFPLTTGLAVIGVNVVSDLLFFNETISASQWLGTLLVIAGIVLLTGK